MTMLMNVPNTELFMIALGAFLIIAALECLSMFVGVGLSHFIDHTLHCDHDANIEVLSWFHIGRVPVLVLIITFLLAFGGSGLLAQFLLYSTMGVTLPAWMIAVPSFVLSLIWVRVFGGFIARILPSDESDAISSEALIGQIATITLGIAQQGSPAPAKAKDQFGQDHHFLVAPDVKGDVFNQGQRVVLVHKVNSVFYAIPNTVIPDMIGDSEN